MRIHIFCVLILVATALVTGTALAQNDTTPDEMVVEDDSQTVDVDATVSVEDWSYDDARYTVTLNASEDTTAHLMPPLDTDGGSANYEARSVDLVEGEPRTVSVPADGELLIVTDDFLDHKDYAVLDGSDPLIGGPWTSDDALLVFLASSLTVAIGTVIRVVIRLSGVGDSAEQIA